MATRSKIAKLVVALALASALGATACRSGSTEPDYRPSNPPPPPQYTPRALEQGGLGVPTSDEVDGADADALKREAEPADDDAPAPDDEQ